MPEPEKSRNRSWFPSKKKIFAALLFAYLFRLGFGLSLPFWSEDQLQTYLIGLKSYTTGTWPYFGPDLGGSETSYHAQLPGALDGLVMGLPFHVLPIPEAPFFLINLLNLFALAVFAWYCSKRVPNLSPWFIFGSILVLPWSLNEFTGIIHRSLCLFGSSLFFLGFLESIPGFTLGILRPAYCNALMGFSIFWVMQFHMSWIYLTAFFGLSLFLQWRSDSVSLLKVLLPFALGALPSVVFILPTLLKYGLVSDPNGHHMTAFFNFGNFKGFFTILARWLSMASYEMPFFLDPPGSPGFTNWGPASGPDLAFLKHLGPSTHARLQFLLGSPFTLVPGVFLWIVGLIQPLVMLGIWFFPKHPLKDWKVMRLLALAGFFAVYASFWFTVKWPLSHIYCDGFFPVVFLYSLYCWSKIPPSKGWRTFAKVYLAAAFIFQAAYAWRIYPVYSLYRDRPRIVKALQEKDYRIVGERRAGVLY